MKCHIRPMTTADLNEVAEIIKLADLPPLNIQQLKHHFKTHHAWVSCLADQAVLGFVIAQSIDNMAEILNIAVHPGWQRQRLGQKLMQACLLQLKEKNLKEVWLEVRANNASALQLYSKLGFKKVGQRKNYYRTAQGHQDAILMSLTLP